MAYFNEIQTKFIWIEHDWEWHCGSIGGGNCWKTQVAVGRRMRRQWRRNVDLFQWRERAGEAVGVLRPRALDGRFSNNSCLRLPFFLFFFCFYYYFFSFFLFSFFFFFCLSIGDFKEIPLPAPGLFRVYFGWKMFVYFTLLFRWISAENVWIIPVLMGD